MLMELISFREEPKLKPVIVRVVAPEIGSLVGDTSVICGLSHWLKSILLFCCL